MLRDHRLVYGAGLFLGAVAVATNVTTHAVSEGLCFDAREMCSPMLPPDYDKPSNDEPMPLHRINPLTVAVSTSIGPPGGSNLLMR